VHYHSVSGVLIFFHSIIVSFNQFVNLLFFNHFSFNNSITFFIQLNAGSLFAFQCISELFVFYSIIHSITQGAMAYIFFCFCAIQALLIASHLSFIISLLLSEQFNGLVEISLYARKNSALLILFIIVSFVFNKQWAVVRVCLPFQFSVERWCFSHFLSLVNFICAISRMNFK
jgi:hypothetical protein